MSFKQLWLAAVAVLLVAGGCKRSGSTEGAGGAQAATQVSAQAADFRFKVRTTPVQIETLVAVREASGRIEPDRDVRVASRIAEKVVAVPVREGDQVNRNQLLVQLDDRHYRDQVRRAELAVEQARIALHSTEKQMADQGERLRAQLDAARRNLATAKKRLDEAQALLTLGGIAPVEVDQLRAAASQASSNAAAAEAAYLSWKRRNEEDLAQLRLQLQQAEVALNQARQALADTRILAPFAGQVAARFVESGAFVGSGTPVVQLITGPRNVIFRLAPDDAARLNSDGLELLYLGKKYPLFIERTTPVPGQDQLVRVYARPTKTSDELPFGGAVLVRYRVHLAQGPQIPATAVRVREGQTFVFTVENGKARAVPVEIVAEANEQVVIRVDAVPERVIFPLPQDLRDGSRVEVIE